MLLDPEFLAILVCPVTRRPLHEATADELASVNAAIAAGHARSEDGKPVGEKLEAALIVDREPGAAELVLYPIRTGIPVLLAAEAIRVPAGANRPGSVDSPEH